MLVLFETPAGYALFKLLDEKKLSHTDNLYRDFETPEGASKIVKLKCFEKFTDTTEALAATNAAIEGKIHKSLKKLLNKALVQEVQDQLLVADSKLGSAIKDKFNVHCMSNNAVTELMRCIRSQADNLVKELTKKEITAMALGLAHSLSRYKLKFSSDKVDTMIVQSICLLDDLDKEINNYVMRCREWYGWHFPELGRIITDNIVFVKAVQLIGTRDHVAETDLSDILPEDVEEKVKEAAEISMGTEISDDDIISIQHLCEQVVEMSNYRTSLYSYLQSRMMAIAPNLTVLLGELVGARLMSQSGSLINLAKQPASTLQLLGAEKALFRALKSKSQTPKYGLIYHSNLVGLASTKNKGKISRMLAAKVALSVRYDALGEDITADLGIEHKATLEKRLRLLEEGNLRRISGTAKAKAKLEKYHNKSVVLQYSSAMDSTLESGKRKHSDAFVKEEPDQDESEQKVEGKRKKIKTEVKKEPVDPDTSAIKTEEETGEGESPKKKKKKKKKAPKVEEAAAVAVEEEIPDTSHSQDGDDSMPAKKKKKKKKIKVEEEES